MQGRGTGFLHPRPKEKLAPYSKRVWLTMAVWRPTVYDDLGYVVALDSARGQHLKDTSALGLTSLQRLTSAARLQQDKLNRLHAAMPDKHSHAVLAGSKDSC